MSKDKINKILRIDSSACHSQSITRRLGDEVMRRLKRTHPGADLIERDLSSGIGIRDVRLVYAEGTSANVSASEYAAFDMLAQWLPVEATTAAA